MEPQWIFLIVFAVVGFFGYRLVSKHRGGVTTPAMSASRADQDEALFVSMFPELQPHFHPRKLLAFVQAGGNKASPAGAPWPFDVVTEQGVERTRVLDAQGAPLAAFAYEEIENGGVMRLGKGKLTVRTLTRTETRKKGVSRVVQDPTPRVSYWHPDREFKWSPRDGWRFRTAMAEDAFPQRDTDTHVYSPGNTVSASSESARPFEGGGGSFDGGGASGGWDDASPAQSTASSPSY
ncbi:hypothetical protein BWI17_19795 [Betaproteobacteria bacterium GR16-43]|nr:hypothetical protein BWI17_19795 [Betaproteobacteria bacterium GR16-43]